MLVLWATAALAAGLMVSASATAPADPVADLVRICREELDRHDTFKAIQTLEAHPDPLVAADAYGKLQGDLYWQAHDVPKFIAVSRAGIQYCLARARQLGEGEPATKLRGQAKALAYDLASFTWPGWDEKGITLDKADVLVGLDAARVNLRLADELKRGPSPMSSAHWVLGAQQMALGQHAIARQSFVKAAEFAAKTDDKLLPVMLEGYLGLPMILEGGPEKAKGQARYEAAVAALGKDGSDDAKVYADQLRSALRVFASRGPGG